MPIDPTTLLSLIRSAIGTGSQAVGAVVPDVGSGIGALGGPAGIAAGIMGGNPLQAIGGAAKTAGTIGNLAAIPELSQGAGALTGPLGLVGGVMSGNPISALTGAAQTASLISGQLGGPTLGSLLGGGAGLAGSALAGGAAAVPLALAGAIFNTWRNNQKAHEAAQGFERSTYAKEWPGLTGARTAGAGLLDFMPEITAGSDPATIAKALALATGGIRATDLASGFQNLSGESGGKPNDLQGWAAQAPALEGQNWAAWLSAMDAANKAGIDAGGIQAKSIGGYAKRPSDSGTLADYLPSGHQANPITDYGTSTINLHGGGPPIVPVSEADPSLTTMTTYEPGRMGGSTTQQANDVSNAIAGVGQQLGLNWGARGPEYEDGTWKNQGYTILPEQLKEYGFTNGNYAPAALNYLKTLDPTIVDRPEWTEYTTKMGITPEQLAAQPQGLTALIGSPFAGGIA